MSQSASQRKREKKEMAARNALIRSRSRAAPLLTQHSLFLGRTGVGKSYHICRMLQDIYPKIFDKIYFVHGTFDRDHYAERFDGIPDDQIFREWDDSIIETIENEAKAMRDERGAWFPLVLIDDQLGAWANSPSLSRWMTRCRHEGVTVFATVQACKSLIPKVARSQFSDVFIAVNTSHEDRKVSEEFSVDVDEHRAALAFASAYAREHDDPYVWLHVRPSDRRCSYYLDVDRPIEFDGRTHSSSGSRLPGARCESDGEKDEASS